MQTNKLSYFLDKHSEAYHEKIDFQPPTKRGVYINLWVCIVALGLLPLLANTQPQLGLGWFFWLDWLIRELKHFVIFAVLFHLLVVIGGLTLTLLTKNFKPSRLYLHVLTSWFMRLSVLNIGVYSAILLASFALVFVWVLPFLLIIAGLSMLPTRSFLAGIVILLVAFFLLSWSNPAPPKPKPVTYPRVTYTPSPIYIPSPTPLQR